MAELNRWWHSDPRERFWLEIRGEADSKTHESELGHELLAPQTDLNGRPIWRYGLCRETRIGDVIVHLVMSKDRRDAGIVATSLVAGPVEESTINWAPRGFSAGKEPWKRPAFKVPLSTFRLLEPQISLTDIRSHARELERIFDSLEAAHGTLYRPFEISDKRGLNVVQSYMTKLPRAVYELLLKAPRAGSSSTTGEQVEVQSYREGRLVPGAPTQVERNQHARRACLKHHGVRCVICGLDFGEKYGATAEGFIHVHHVIPAKLRAKASRGEGYEVDPIHDLRPVCPNCHGVIHLGGECRSIEEVRGMVASPARPRR